MIPFQIYQNKSKISDKIYLRWYARTISTNTVGINEIAERMALNNSPFSKGAIIGLLTDMVSCIKEFLLEGKNVKINNLAIFSTSIENVKGGALSYNDFNVQKHIKGVKINALATGVLSKSMLINDASLQERKSYYRTKTDSAVSKLYNIIYEQKNVVTCPNQARQSERVSFYLGDYFILDKIICSSGEIINDLNILSKGGTYIFTMPGEDVIILTKPKI